MNTCCHCRREVDGSIDDRLVLECIAGLLPIVSCAACDEAAIASAVRSQVENWKRMRIAMGMWPGASSETRIRD